jgi:flagellar hook assembly protein FlgD
VELVVYDLSGKKVRTLVNATQESGMKTVTWNGKDEQGRSVAAGVYVYRLQAGGYMETKKMVLLK